MILYFACADRIKDDGTKEQISTYEGTITEEEARKQFAIWTEHYKFQLWKCWIDLYDTVQNKIVDSHSVE